jgi:hypothetical protein
LSLRGDLRINLALDTSGADLAESIGEKLRASRRDAKVGGTLDVQVEGNTVRLHYLLEGAELVRSISEAAAKGFDPGALLTAITDLKNGVPGESAGRLQTPVPEPGRGPNKVTIYGLDEGPREILIPERP